ncbi:TetR/AcrR family transcriptional regulator [Streptomonospora sp. S1-112]|uniref:TetR/AcrR family transcriptional regulator n=1 Tax=Streptomonospora mangrovi TaxID=2883123 RepID=A0A9X3NG05_9ACTN|nr:TetR family transcriptional regulator [Streptomonospora mangrovi]MDA0562847.1 TetR/AcrR family transcriptional regulator [Streptomonospora mangrovi]
MMAPRDSAATRRKLLEAGRAEFAEHGIAGGRIDRIAESAGVNKERVYGHFGSKEKLFQAVLEAVKAEHAATLPAPDEDIGEWVGRLFDSHAANRTMVRLMMWEALYFEDRPLPDDTARADVYATKVLALARSAGVEPDSTAAMMLLCLLGLGTWPFAMPQMARLIIGPRALTPAGRAELRAHVVAMASAAVAGTVGGAAGAGAAPAAAEEAEGVGTAPASAPGSNESVGG